MFNVRQALKNVLNCTSGKHALANNSSRKHKTSCVLAACRRIKDNLDPALGKHKAGKLLEL